MESAGVDFLSVSETFSSSGQSRGHENATLPQNQQQPGKALFLATGLSRQHAASHAAWSLTQVELVFLVPWGKNEALANSNFTF